MIDIREGDRVFIRTLALYYEGTVEHFDGCWIKLSKPKTVFNVGNMSATKTGAWAEAETDGRDFTNVNVNHVVDIGPITVTK